MPRARVRVLPYKMGSRSATRLARSLGVLKVYNEPDRSRFRGRYDDFMINWGLSHKPVHLQRAKFINHPSNVALSVDKRKTLQRLHERDVSALEYTTDRQTAIDWYYCGQTVVVRTSATSHSGYGIVLMDPNATMTPQDMPHAPLYTKYVKKNREYRVHVFPHLGTNFVQQKRRSYDVPDDEVDWHIRNYSNGFIFACNSLQSIPNDLVSEATKAVSALELDFGCVDILWNGYQDKLYVIEVNSACGLEGDSTLEFYKSNIERILP